MLEKNRMEAVSLSRFFSVIQQPFMPEEQALPRRWYATATILIVGFLVFLVFRALTHSVFETS
jgi:capsule polysaccharide export protein KpsE/RkpR